MEERKYYPLSKEQEGLVMLAGLFPFPNLLYLFTEIDFVSDISEERLLDAIRISGERLPYCRVRLHDMDDGSCMQYCSEEAPDPVEIIDLSQGTEEELESLKLQWQKENFPNNQRDVQLYRFRLIRMPGGKHVLHLVVHHFIMDAFSMMNTVRYVDAVYSALSRGEQLPPEAPLPWKLLEEENAYFGSKKEERDGQWWRAQYETEPMFCSVNGLGGPEYVEGKRYGRKQSFEQMFTELLRMRIPKELVDQVNASAAERKLSPQVYYMLALRSYLAHVNKSDDVMVVTPMAMRSTLYQKSAGFSIAKTAPVRMAFPSDLPFGEALNRVAAAENEVYRHAHYEYFNLKADMFPRFEVPDDCTYDSVWLTYQPFFKMGSSELRFVAKMLDNGFVPIPLYMLVQPQDDTGDLYGIYCYALGYTKKESCEQLHAFMLRFLELGVAEPEQSLEELIRRSL